MNITDSVLTRPSVCPLDCPDTCSLAVATDGVRILDVRGSRANPYTAGVICNKVARLVSRVRARFRTAHAPAEAGGSPRRRRVRADLLG